MWVPLHFLSKIEITSYFSYEPRFNSVFSKNILPEIKDGACAINFDDKRSNPLLFLSPKLTYWISLFIDKNTAVYFDSFGIEYIPQWLLDKIRDKSITHSIFRIQDNDSIMCETYCITFMEYMFAGKTLLDYTNLFFPNDYKKNDKIIRKCFKRKHVRV